MQWNCLPPPHVRILRAGSFRKYCFGAFVLFCLQTQWRVDQLVRPWLQLRQSGRLIAKHFLLRLPGPHPARKSDAVDLRPVQAFHRCLLPDGRFRLGNPSRVHSDVWSLPYPDERMYRSSLRHVAWYEFTA